MKKQSKNTWLSRLLNSKDLTVNASTLYMLISLTLSALLFLTVIVVLIVEIAFNHTITTDLTGLAALLGAASAPGVSGGVVKGWSVYSHAKHDNTDTSTEYSNENLSGEQ